MLCGVTSLCGFSSQLTIQSSRENLTFASLRTHLVVSDYVALGSHQGKEAKTSSALCLFVPYQYSKVNVEFPMIGPGTDCASVCMSSWHGLT
jgi:hypothetical protein